MNTGLVILWGPGSKGRKSQFPVESAEYFETDYKLDFREFFRLPTHLKYRNDFGIVILQNKYTAIYALPVSQIHLGIYIMNSFMTCCRFVK